MSLFSKKPKSAGIFSKVTLHEVIRVCPGKMHAWIRATVAGKERNIKKQISNIPASLMTAFYNS